MINLEYSFPKIMIIVVNSINACFLIRLQNIYRKIDKISDILYYFADKEWTFNNKNVLRLWDKLDGRDKELFNFDVHQLSWDYFCQAHCLGLRVYLTKDDIHTLPAARKKWQK